MQRSRPGYISSETLRSLDDTEDFLVISRWETADDWKKWLQSKERRDIQGKMDSLIGEKTFYEIFRDHKPLTRNVLDYQTDGQHPSQRPY